jgi:L-serine dehydratase
MKSKHIPSIFNDVMGPVMRGPSSSHTAAAHRIGNIIRQASSNFTKVVVKFDKTSSLATTYLGQGSALGLAGGLLGLEMTDPEIVNYEKNLGNSNFTIEYIITEIENKHPNAYQIKVQYPDREDLNILAISTGGGMIEILEWNKFKVSIRGDFYETILIFPNVDVKDISEIEQTLNNFLSGFKLYESQDINGNLLINCKSATSLSKQIDRIPDFNIRSNQKVELIPVMPVPSASEIELPFTTVNEMMNLASSKNLSLSDLAIMYESSRTSLDTNSIRKKMEEIVLIVKGSIDEGLKGTYYEDRIMGTQSTLIETAEKKGLIDKTINNTIIAYTSAIMEVKSSMGLVVAIPTAGSCGTVGGALFGSLQEKEFNLKQMTSAFLTAGIIGVFIASKYTFAAEEGGCQVETGSAAAMAAAGLVELNGGTAIQAINAASMALQNELGIICDPVAVRVELPCLGKNIVAATNALNSSIMAIAGYDPVIPYDEVIDAMKAVGETMPSSLCCTGLGGLAQTPTGKCLYQKFNDQ